MTATLALALVFGRGQIDGGVSLEEPVGFERETSVLHGHHREILRPRYVNDAERMPQHEVALGNVPVVFDKLGQTFCPGPGRRLVYLLTFERSWVGLTECNACMKTRRCVLLSKRSRTMVVHSELSIYKN